MTAKTKQTQKVEGKDNGTNPLIARARAVWDKGGAVVPIPRKGIEYTDSKGEKRVTGGKGPDFTPGYLKRRLTWPELEKKLQRPEFVALGIIGGSLSVGLLRNLGTLDFDGDGWRPVYDVFLESWPELIPSSGTITGSGKRHKRAICEGMPDDFTVKKFERPDLDAAIELRGRHNTVFAGLHPDGGHYEPESEGAEVVNVDFVDLYNWLADWAGVARWNESSKEHKASPKIEGDILEGTRDDTLTSIAGTMRRRGLGANAIKAALSVVNQDRCKPPLPDTDVRRIAGSVARYEPGDPVGTKNGNGSAAPATVAASDDGDVGYMLSLPADDDGHADCVRRYTDGTLVYCKELGWLTYNGKYFDTNSETRARGIVKNILKIRRKAARAANLEDIRKSTKFHGTGRISSTLYHLAPDVLVSADDFDNEPHLLNCDNGVVDLRTGELLPHSPEQRFTYCVPTAYNPNADLTTWASFVETLTGGPLMARYLQEVTGYSITGETSEEIMIYLWGPPRGGKGAFTETLIGTLGKMPLATEVDMRTFTQSRSADSQNFALAPLRPCRFVAASESADNERLNGAKVKVITGGNYINCAHKNKDPFSYRPRFKIWLSSNYPVNGDPDDDALWSRLRVIECPNSFVGKEDKTLKRRLLSRANKEAVLAWAVAGARRWYERDEKGLFTPRRVIEATDEHREQQDFVGQWLREYIEKTDNDDDFIPNAQLYGSYKAWCSLNGVTPKYQAKLTQTLKKKGYQAGKQKKVNGRNSKGCKGARFLDVSGNGNG